jgi:hypothetical protein
MAAPVRRNPPSVPAREGIQRRQLRERLSAPAREQTWLCAADPIAKNAPSRWAAHGAITASLAAAGYATRNRDPRQSRDPTGSEVSMKLRNRVQRRSRCRGGISGNGRSRSTRTIRKLAEPRRRPRQYRKQSAPLIGRVLRNAGIDRRSCGASIGAKKVAGRMYPFGPKGPGAAVPGPSLFCRNDSRFRA